MVGVLPLTVVLSDSGRLLLISDLRFWCYWTKVFILRFWYPGVIVIGVEIGVELFGVPIL